MDRMGKMKSGATRRRWDIAVKDRAFDAFRNLELIKTQAEHFLEAIHQGTVSTNVFFSSRSAAKGAVEALTRNLAFELAPRHVRVNALSIGWTATEQVKALPPEFVQPNVERAAMRRLATPEEVANTAFHYVSSEFSFITGCIIPVDGGCFV